MARLRQVDLDPANVDADGICAAQSAGGAGALTLNGALTSGGVFTESGAFGRQISITSANNDSGITFTVTGTCPDGVAQTEAITGPNATTVEGASYFRTITGISVSGATVGNITIGTVDEVATKSYPLNARSADAATIACDVTGTVNYTVQEAFEDVLSMSSPAQNATWFNVSALASKTTDIASPISRGASAVRLVFNSYTDGAEIQMNISEGYI
jgi:hypothetical protein